MQGNLLCQAAKLGSRDMLLSPGMRKAVLSHRPDISNSQEFFQHTYNRPGEQTDADDEEDSEQVCIVYIYL